MQKLTVVHFLAANHFFHRREHYLAWHEFTDLVNDIEWRIENQVPVAKKRQFNDACNYAKAFATPTRQRLRRLADRNS